MDKKSKIVIVGTGAFGTAIAEAIVSNKTNDIVLFGINPQEIEDINSNHKNSKYYGFFKLDPKLRATKDPFIAFDNVDIVVLAIPSATIKTVLLQTIIPNLKKPCYFVNLAKGLDFLRTELLSDVIKETVPKELCLGILKLAGGSFAIEVIKKVPTLFTLACEDRVICEGIKTHFISDSVNVICNENLRGIEALSVVKNPLALLLGIIAGLGYTMNAKAYMFTEAVNEMEKMMDLFGVKNPKDIIFQPAGIGDLFLTGNSLSSRNYSTGYKIGKADKVTKKVLSTYTTVEGLRTTELLMVLKEKQKISLPLIELIYNITYKKEIPSKTIEEFFKKNRKV